MQVDASFGLSAAVTEMLVQSNEGYLNFLPAIPDTWAPARKFSGVVVRGAFELDYQWKDGIVSDIGLLSKAGNTCKIKFVGKPTVTLEGKRIKVKKELDGVYSFATVQNGSYKITTK